MGGALLSAWLSSGQITARNLAILDPKPGVEAVYAIERGAKHLADFNDIPKTIKTVLLAVKPLMFSQIRRPLAEAIGDDVLIISIMGGITTAALKDAFPAAKVARAMPNTPATLGKGVITFVADADLDEKNIATIKDLFDSNGKIIRIESDALINATAAVSVSGPAYVFHLCEALSKAAQSIGLSPELSDVLARETIIGASAMLETSDRSATELREAETTPGGKTQAALDVLMNLEDGQGQLMRRAMKAAVDRAKELSG